MSYTIYDIAKAAGVSIATVSRVFNNSESVKPSTRQKVLETADEMGFQPHLYAQGLASKKRNKIMMLVPMVSNYFLTEILKGVQDSLSAHNFELNIINISQAEDTLQQVEHVLRKRWAEGYLLVSLHFTNEQLNRLKRYNVPLTLVDDNSSLYDSYSFDNTRGAFIATEHLVKEGFRNIAVLSASENSLPVRERISGYKQALEKYGIPFRENWIVSGTDPNVDGFTEQSGYEAMNTILQLKPEPDAVFCVSDIKAVGAQKAMREQNRTIPLISFDNIPLAEYIGLSTINQPMYQMGRNATEKLIERIQQSSKMDVMCSEVFKPNLIIRESSDPQFINR